MTILPRCLKGQKAVVYRRRLIFLCCAAVYWTFYCIFSIDTLFFNGISWKFRILFLFVLLALSVLLDKWIEGVLIRKDSSLCSVTKSIVLQLVPMLILFLIVYPGSWSWDDVGVLEYAKDYRFSGFQHFLTSLYLILCLYFIPSAAGATAVQTVVISVLSGWTVAKVEQDLLPRLSLPGKLLLRLSFFLPPMIFHNYLFFRNVLCAYIELALLVFAVSVFRSAIRTRDWIILSLGTALLSSWRSENIYYLPFFFLYLLFAGRSWHISSAPPAAAARAADSARSELPHRFFRRLLLFVSVCVLVLAVGKYNNHVIGTNNYSVLTTACPGIALYREAVKEPERNAKEISAIEKVLNKEAIESYPDAGGAELYWTGELIGTYTDHDYTDYLFAVFRLISRYPGTFLRERWKIFADSLGINREQVMYVRQTVLMFREGSGFQEYSGYSSVTSEAPLFPKLREKLMLLVGNLREDLSFTPAHYIVWNLIPPMLILLAGFVVFLTKRQYIEVGCLFALLCKIPVLFLTAPACFFMYYISIYLAGYFLLFSALASRWKSSNRQYGLKIRRFERI